ncbi:SRPBCC family protein [Nocardioides aromaticivorans]|uniref:SRPBCC family protein n=1 Tax=Nocardioides aromaticivorans TaxID=200618 RepID=UPI0015C70AF0|nr:SRPBCC family protein [Nocardioides aromaticivorans]
MSRIQVAFPVPADRAFAYLADPRNRPAWQSSLRAVADVVPVDGDATAAGTTWTDVTVVPGVRPRMRTTLAEPGVRWVEEGRCGPFRAELALFFSPAEDGSAVVAEFSVRGIGVGRLVTLASRAAVAADLRRAAQLAGGA